MAGRPRERRTFRRSVAALAALALGMVTATAVAQPARQEIDARAYQWRGEDSIAGIERAMDAVGHVYRSADRRDRQYGAGGRLQRAENVHYEYDEDGHQTQKSSSEGDWHYRWNGHGLLREVERPDGVRVVFEYDAFARRTGKRIIAASGVPEREVHFVWDRHQVLHELDSETGLTTWYWQPESFTPVAKESGGHRWAIASDHLGTPTEMYDERGELAWKMQLDVFGVASVERGSAQDCPWRWPGQYEDRETGLYWNWHRAFDARQERYVSEDPIGLRGGTALYGYVDDPLTWIDPWGLSQSKACGAAGGLPALPRSLGTAANITTRSRIGASSYATRLAEGLGQAAQRDVDALLGQLRAGNMNPGIGTRTLGGGFFELRGANAGRVIVKQTGAGSFDIVGKFQGHVRGDAANSAIIQRLINDYLRL